MFLPLLLTVRCTSVCSMDGISPARYAAGLLLPVLGVEVIFEALSLPLPPGFASH